jgi:hypothetical protein
MLHHLKEAIVDRLAAMRGPSESYSDVILWLVEIEAGARLEASDLPEWGRPNN